MKLIVAFICRRCANNADAGNLVHSDCGQHCDCQHGQPRVKHARRGK